MTIVFLAAIVTPITESASASASAPAPVQSGSKDSVARGEIRRSPSTGAEEQAQYEARLREK